MRVMILVDWRMASKSVRDPIPANKHALLTSLCSEYLTASGSPRACLGLGRPRAQKNGQESLAKSDRTDKVCRDEILLEGP